MGRKGLTGIEIMLVAAVLGLILAIVIPITCQLISTGVQKDLYNERYGTDYTYRQFFFAGYEIKNYLEGGTQTTTNQKISIETPIKVQFE